MISFYFLIYSVKYKFRLTISYMYKPKIENLPKETYKEDCSDILAAIYTLKKMSIRIHTVKKN